MNQYGKDGLHIDGHSRGSMTTGNALESIQNQPDSQGSLSQTTINFFGPAYNTKLADDILGGLQNRDEGETAADKNNSVLKFMNHDADPVGGLIGRNPGTGGMIPEGSSIIKEALKVLGGEFTAHNCYLSGTSDCERYWNGFPKNTDLLKAVRKY